jgi:hypothetical protein
MNETALTTFNSEDQKRWAEMAELIKKSAQTRRRQRTPQSKIKSRSGGGDKSFKYVDRADYQIWLDDTFPGWTIEEFECWTEKSITSAQTIPMLFCVKFMLCVVDSGMAKRRIPCIGTASVAEKELGRDNATLLKQKYNSAFTEGIKMGCNWMGAFFDLRADDEEREKAASPATPEQFAKFTALLNQVPVAYKDETTKAWNKMNASTADAFIKGLQDKLNKLTPVKD